MPLWTVAFKAPLSMGFSRQEYWSGLPCLSPGDLPNLRIKPESSTAAALIGRFFATEPPGVDTQDRGPQDDRGRLQGHLGAEERPGLPMKPQAKREPRTRSSQSLWEHAHRDLDFRPSASRTGGGWLLGFKPPSLWLFFTPALGTRALGPR